MRTASTQKADLYIYAKNCEKSAVKDSIEKYILSTYVYNYLSKIVWGKIFSFLTRSRPLDLKHFCKFDVFDTPKFAIFYTLASSKNLVLNGVPIVVGQYFWKGFTFFH